MTSFSPGKRLKEALEERNISMREAARRARIPSPTLSQFATGKNQDMYASSLLRLCRVLGVSPFWLVRGEGERDGGDVATWNEADLERLLVSVFEALGVDAIEPKQAARLAVRLHRNVALGREVPSAEEVANILSLLV